MSKRKGFVQIGAKTWVERFRMAWVIMRYGHIVLDFEVLEEFAKSYIEAERKKIK